MNEDHSLHQLSLDLFLLGDSYKQQLVRMCTLTIDYSNISMQKTFGQDPQCPCYSELKLDNLCWSSNTWRANACHLSSGSGIIFQQKTHSWGDKHPTNDPWNHHGLSPLAWWLAADSFRGSDGATIKSSHLQVSEHYEPIPEIYSQDLSKVSFRWRDWRDAGVVEWKKKTTTFEKECREMLGTWWVWDWYDRYW